MARPAYVIAYDHILQPDGTWKRRAVRFARFRNIADCFGVYGRYLFTSDFYKGAYKRKTLKGFVCSLAQHYAQDPEYAVKLMAIIQRYDLAERAK
jgi:flagellum-specific peptidoglycan hydrolase FlgJ